MCHIALCVFLAALLTQMHATNHKHHAKKIDIQRPHVWIIYKHHVFIPVQRQTPVQSMSNKETDLLVVRIHRTTKKVSVWWNSSTCGDTTMELGQCTKAFSKIGNICTNVPNCTANTESKCCSSQPSFQLLRALVMQPAAHLKWAPVRWTFAYLTGIVWEFDVMFVHHR